MNRFTKYIGAGIGLLSGAVAGAQDRPNIVVFLVDDMGLMDTSLPFVTDKDGNPVEQPLNRWYRTPNMERLAAQGTRFTQFYAQSVSSPSRTSLLTGPPTGSTPKATTATNTAPTTGTGTALHQAASLTLEYSVKTATRQSMSEKPISPTCTPTAAIHAISGLTST